LLLKGNMGLPIDGWVPADEISPTAEGAILVCTVLHPLSAGTVELASSDPLAPPRIHAGYLTSAPDLAVLVDACKQAVALARQPALAGLLSPTPLLPPELVRKHGVAWGSDASRRATPPALPDAFWEEYCRRYASTLYHAVGTARIGTVVDAELRVVGARGLRVADASVQPEIVSGNTNASIIMIAEKAAKLLRAAHGLADDGGAALRGVAAAEMRARRRLALVVVIALAGGVAAATWGVCFRREFEL